MLNANIASMPLARQLSYIRKTMTIGNLVSKARMRHNTFAKADRHLTDN